MRVPATFRTFRYRNSGLGAGGLVDGLSSVGKGQASDKKVEALRPELGAAQAGIARAKGLARRGDTDVPPHLYPVLRLPAGPTTIATVKLTP